MKGDWVHLIVLREYKWQKDSTGLSSLTHSFILRYLCVLNTSHDPKQLTAENKICYFYVMWLYAFVFIFLYTCFSTKWQVLFFTVELDHNHSSIDMSVTYSKI